MTKPTPTPWSYEQDDLWWRITAQDVGGVAEEIETEANARLIVRAVNSHEAMVEAMQEFVDRCERGEVRSKYTYNKFKTLLALARGDDDD